MKNFFNYLLVCLLCAFLANPLNAASVLLKQTGGGLQIGATTGEKVAFHGSTPVARRVGAAQTAITDSTGGSTADHTFAAITAPTALTDSTTGTASATLAATAGVSTVTVPLSSLATGLSTAAIDLLTNYTPGYRFKVLSFSFVTTVAGTGASASQVFNLEIGTTNVTGGVLTVALADTDTIGKATAATAVSAANVGTASDTLSIEMAASGTAFTAGGGYFVITLQNMDSADAVASLAARQAEDKAAIIVLKNNDAKNAILLNELRAALVEKGLIKGGA